MKPTGVDTRTDTDTARAERVEQQRARQAQLRTLADHHAALAREFRALHEQAQALQTREVSRAERRAQIHAVVRAEGEVLDQAQHVRQSFQRLLVGHRRFPQ
jgi:hypothetical protein